MPRGVYNRKTKTTDDADPVEESEPQAVDATDPTEQADELDTGEETKPTEAPADADEGAGDAPQREVVDEPPLCSEHFPEGWPAGVTSAGCIHGQWERELPDADGA